MNGSHHRLGAGFDAVAHLGQDGVHGWATKLANVSTGNERAARAQQQHTLDGSIRLGLVHRRHQATAHIHADGVDGRMVNRDDQQVAVFGCANHGRFGMGGQTGLLIVFVLHTIVWQIIFLDNLKLY
jgi:hypothetical protein